jgi:hypothetical protein
VADNCEIALRSVFLEHPIPGILIFLLLFNHKIHYCVPVSSPLDSISIQFNPIHTLLSLFAV